MTSCHSNENNNYIIKQEQKPCSLLFRRRNSSVKDLVERLESEAKKRTGLPQSLTDTAANTASRRLGSGGLKATGGGVAVGRGLIFPPPPPLTGPVFQAGLPSSSAASGLSVSAGTMRVTKPVGGMAAPLRSRVPSGHSGCTTPARSSAVATTATVTSRTR
jgi:hypothetical protein